MTAGRSARAGARRNRLHPNATAIASAATEQVDQRAPAQTQPRREDAADADDGDPEGRRQGEQGEAAQADQPGDRRARNEVDDREHEDVGEGAERTRVLVGHIGGHASREVDGPRSAPATAAAT